jgi:hypothetical protein
MAVSNEESQANLAKLKGAGLTDEQITGYGNKLNPTEAGIILSKYGIDPNSVLSAGNIASTINNPTPYPTDLLGIQAYAKNQYGVDDLKATYDKSVKDWQDFQAITDDRKVSLSKIAGIKGSQATKFNNAITNAFSAFQYGSSQADNLANVLNQELQEKKELQLKYTGADIQLTDTWDQALEKVTKFNKKQAENEAFYNIYGVYLSDRPKGTSKKEWEKKWKKDKKKKKEYEEEVERLELEKLKLSIEDTKSLIANRGKESGSDFDPESDTEIRQIINEAHSSGETWQTIADTLAAIGVDVSSGSVADNELRRLHGNSPITKRKRG